MKQNFNPIFLEEAYKFLSSLSKPLQEEILVGIIKASYSTPYDSLTVLSFENNYEFKIRTKFAKESVLVDNNGDEDIPETTSKTKEKESVFSFLTFLDQSSDNKSLIIAAPIINATPDALVHENKKAEAIKRLYSLTKNKANGVEGAVNMNDHQVKLYDLEALKDLHFGTINTPERKEFDFRLGIELVAMFIKTERLKRNISQQALSVESGVSKLNISKLEKDPTSVPMGMLVKVLHCLDANLKLLLAFKDKEHSFPLN